MLARLRNRAAHPVRHALRRRASAMAIRKTLSAACAGVQLPSPQRDRKAELRTWPYLFAKRQERLACHSYCGQKPVIDVRHSGSSAVAYSVVYWFCEELEKSSAPRWNLTLDGAIDRWIPPRMYRMLAGMLCVLLGTLCIPTGMYRRQGGIADRRLINFTTSPP